MNLNADDEMAAVETLCLEFLKRPALPKYYQAQAYAFLSNCEDYDRAEWLIYAAELILEARDEQE